MHPADFRGTSNSFYCFEHRPTVARLAACPLEEYSDANVPTAKCGPMTHQCKYEPCKAYHFASELTRDKPHFPLCCNNGKVVLPDVPKPPDALGELLEGRNRRALQFKDRIRYYNGALCFVSFGLDIFENVAGRGPPVIKSHGQVYHLAGRLFPADDDDAGYAQLYLYDHGDALRKRSQRNPDLDKVVLETLQTVIEVLSPYFETYKQMEKSRRRMRRG